ncbi:uncharacterized protein LOC121381555 [Gigantopelta aegis]|uniref:uncharacterized protein LOC121381555 n=1 Tax=Gigantopelta aegis TaxID=1735272 RepID=UPI001B88E233|nr:uncharacterized protein LOC121381555 [Gigantopelta aegis]
MLVDTGSVATVISRKVYDTLGSNKPVLQTCANTLCAADGGPLHVYGQALFSIKLGKKVYEHEIIVADLGGLSGIVGLDFLELIFAVLFVTKGVLKMPDNELWLHHEVDNVIAHIRLSENVIIPSETEMIIKGIVDRPVKYGWEGIVESDGSVEKMGLLMPKSLVKVKQDEILFSVLNSGSEYVRLEKGYPVATLEMVFGVTKTDNNRVNSIRETGNSLETIEELPEHLTDLLEQSVKHLTKEEGEQAEKLIREFSDSFVGPKDKLGRTDLVKHYIDTGDAKPIKLPLTGRLPRGQKEVVLRWTQC